MLLATTVPEQEYLGLESLMNLISRSLPMKGGIVPLLYHKIPYVPKKEVSSII